MEIFVGNLPFDLTRSELETAFSPFGEIVKTRMLFDRDGRFRGIAYVEFAETADAKKAIAELNGVDLKGRAMRVDYSRPARPRFEGFGGAFSNPDKKRPRRQHTDFNRGGGDDVNSTPTPRPHTPHRNFRHHWDSTSEKAFHPRSRRDFDGHSKKPFAKKFGGKFRPKFGENPDD